MLPINHNQRTRQRWIVLDALLDDKLEVHVLNAINRLNIVSLTSRIAELKKLGFHIDWRWCDTEHSRFKVYFIKDKAKARALYDDILSGKVKIHASTKKTTKRKTTKRQNNGKPQGK